MNDFRAVLLSTTLTAWLIADASAAGWRSYHNTRFGTTADVPAGWKMEPAPENNDGRRFTSPDGRGEIIISGIRVLDGAKDEIASQLAPGDGEKVTYRKQGARWAVASGVRGDRIFYRKTLITCGDTIANHLWMEYPATERDAYDRIVAHVSASLQPGPGYECR